MKLDKFHFFGLQAYVSPKEGEPKHISNKAETEDEEDDEQCSYDFGKPSRFI